MDQSNDAAAGDKSTVGQANDAMVYALQLRHMLSEKNDTPLAELASKLLSSHEALLALVHDPNRQVLGVVNAIGAFMDHAEALRSAMESVNNRSLPTYQESNESGPQCRS